MLRNLLILMSLHFFLTPPVYSNVPFISFVAIEFGEKASLESIVLTSNKNTLELSGAGLLLNSKRLCRWEKSAVYSDYSLGGSFDSAKNQFVSGSADCPSDSPILTGDRAGYHFNEVSLSNSVLIRISDMNWETNTIQVPFRGSVYSGKLGQGPWKVVVGKNSKLLAKQQKYLNNISIANAALLNKLGLGKMRRKVRNCRTKDPTFISCLDKMISQSFSYSSLGEDLSYDKAKLAKSLGDNQELLSGVAFCFKGDGPKFNQDENAVDLIPDDQGDMYWECRFRKSGDQWFLEKLTWVGC